MNVQDVLLDIHSRHGDLRPDIVVDEAREESHPLHTHFDWDDSSAAEAYRRGQAAALIRRVRIEVKPVGTTDPIKVRAWVAQRDLLPKVQADDEDEYVEAGSYLPVEEVAATPEFRTAWQRSLERDWQRLRKKAGDAAWFLRMVANDIDGQTG